MSDFDANAFLGNESAAPAAANIAQQAKPIANNSSPFDANSFLGNEQGVGEAAGLDERLEQYEQLQKEYGGVGQQALTALEGAGQGLAGPGATLLEAGLSKAGVPGLSPEAQEMRAKANPVARYGSEIGAFGVSSLYGVGEAGLIAKIGKGAVEAADLAKGATIARAAVAGGTELASLQAGNEISKAINQEPGQTLGSAAINIGLAGVLGAGGGAALGKVGDIWKSYVGHAAEDAGVGAAEIGQGEDHLSRSVLKSKEKSSFIAGLQKQKANAAEIREAGDIIGVPVSSSQTSGSDFVQSMDSALSQSPTISGVARQQEIDRGFEKIGGHVDKVLGSLDESSQYQRGQSIKDQIGKTVDDIYKPLKEQYAARGTVGETIHLPDAARLKQFDNLVEISQKFAKADPSVEKMVRDTAEGVLRQDTIADLDEYLKVLSAQRRNLVSGQTPNHYAARGLGEAIESLEDFQVNQIARQGKALAGQGAEHAEAIANDIVNQHKALKAKYAQFKEILGDLASDAKLGRRATTAGGIEDVLESIPNEKLVEKMFDPKNSAGLKRLQKNFPDVFKTVIDGKKADIVAAAGGDSKKILENIFGVNRSGAPKLSPEIRDMMFSQEEQRLLKASKTWVESLPKNVGPSGTPKGAAYMEALRSHPLTTIIRNSKDFAIKTLLKFATPAEIEANKVTSEYINSAIKGQKVLDNATKMFFKGSEVVPQHLLPNEKSRDRLKKHLESLNENPENAVNVGGNIGHHLPNHATAAGSLAAQAINYFNSIKPTQPQMAPLDKKPPVNKTAEAKYNRALDIAQQPLMVLKHAKDGTLQAHDIQTLRAIYPDLHNSIVSKLTENLSSHVNSGKSIPYQERRALSMIIGSAMDSTMTPNSAMAIMHANLGQISQQSTRGGPGGQRKASGKELNQINKVNQMFNTGLEQRQMNRKA